VNLHRPDSRVMVQSCVSRMAECSAACQQGEYETVSDQGLLDVKRFRESVHRLGYIGLATY
jgi:hypothetical protein